MACASTAWAGVPASAQSGRVAIIHAAAWSPGDVVRDGAGEFEVLMAVAKVQRDSRQGAVGGVGGRFGAFPAGAERALRFVAMKGIPVARLAPGGETGLDPQGLFLDGGRLS